MLRPLWAVCKQLHAADERPDWNVLRVAQIYGLTHSFIHLYGTHHSNEPPQQLGILAKRSWRKYHSQLCTLPMCTMHLQTRKTHMCTWWTSNLFLWSVRINVCIWLDNDGAHTQIRALFEVRMQIRALLKYIKIMQIRALFEVHMQIRALLKYMWTCTWGD